MILLITDLVVGCSIYPVDMFSLSEVVEQLLEMHQRPLGHHIPEYPSPEPFNTYQYRYAETEVISLAMNITVTDDFFFTKIHWVTPISLI